MHRSQTSAKRRTKQHRPASPFGDARASTAFVQFKSLAAQVCGFWEAVLTLRVNQVVMPALNGRLGCYLLQNQ